MASMDNNKHKYSADGAEEEAPLKKQKTIGGDDSGDDHGNDGDDHADNDDDGDDEGDDDEDPSSSSSTDDDYSSEPEEEVSSEGEMNIPTGSEEKLLIRQGRSDEEESCRYFSDDY
jgi:hypothetical protein